MAGPEGSTREGEWYVPKFGPRRFRVLVGLSFYPYTFMNVSYVVIGSLVSVAPVHWDRVAAIAIVYLLATGVSAHALDAMAPNKPWGNLLSDRQLTVLALATLIPAAGIGVYYSVAFAPFLIPLGVVEMFFLLAYNLELLGGRFHTDLWFAFSWGMLPVLAGYVLQTDTVSLTALAASGFGFVTAFTEINASRPYKALKKSGAGSSAESRRFESVLKGLVVSHLLLALTLVIFRLSG